MHKKHLRIVGLKKSLRSVFRARISENWFVVVGLVAGLAIAAVMMISSGATPSRAVALAPDQIGLGQGVAACISSGPSVTCDSAGNNVYTFTYDESVHGSSSIYVGITKVVSTYHWAILRGAYYTYVYTPVTGYSAPAVGTASFTQNGGYVSSASGGDKTYYTAAVAANQVNFYSQTFYDSKDLPAALTCTASATSIPPPTTMSESCNAANDQVTLSWTNMSAQGATVYYPRIWIPAVVACAPGWSDWGGNAYGHTCYQNGVSGTSVTYPVTAGTAYNAWVHAGDPVQTNASGVWAVTVVSPSPFTCGAPVAPVAPTPLSTTCNVAGDQVTLSWPAVSGATTYSPGLFLPLGSTCPVGWTSSAVNGYTACQTGSIRTSITAVVPSNVAITGVIYAGNVAGYSSGTTKNFTCNAPPTAALSANPTSVLTGNPSTLSWSSTHATSCTAAGGFSTGGAIKGSVSTGPLVTTSTFSVTCKNSTSTSPPAQATVTVTNPAVAITATPTRVLSNSQTNVSWNAVSVTTCDITRNGVAWKTGLTADGSSNVIGSSPDTITGQTVYKITCTDLSAATQAASVVVNIGNQGFSEF